MTETDRAAWLMRQAPTPRDRSGDDGPARVRYMPPVLWTCVCAGEERQGWRHSLACPVRGPGGQLPPRWPAHPILASEARRLVRNAGRDLWMDDDDAQREARAERGQRERERQAAQPARMTRQQREARAAVAAQLRAAGLTYPQIAAQLGMSTYGARAAALRGAATESDRQAG